jgi:hypothetical protein
VKEKVGGGGSERHYISGGGDGNIIFCLKVPRHCPLVLLIGVRLEFRVNLIFFLILNFKVIEVLERNLSRHQEGYIRAKFQCYHWEGCMGSMPRRLTTQLYRFVRTSQETHYVSATSPTG